MSAPGRLKAEQTLSGFRIQAPGEQRGFRALYIVLFALMTLGGVVGGLRATTGIEFIIEMLLYLPTVSLIGALLWRWLSWILQHIQSGSRLASAVVFLLLFAGFASITIPNTDPAVHLIVSGFSALIYALLIRLFAGQAAVVTIDQSALTVERGRRRWTHPLEEIRDLQRTGKRYKHAEINGQRIVGLSGLKQEEWDWLKQTITDSAERRRRALLAEGHDLTRAVGPPAALATLTTQTPGR